MLIYGSSFAAGVTAQVGFDGLLEAAPQGERWSALNYAVTAYGVDQATLLMERTIEPFVERDPVVVLAFVLESDLERAMTSFYCAPKPRYEWRDGIPTLFPPSSASTSAYLEAHPPSIRSYFWRYLVHGLRVFPGDIRRSLSGWSERQSRRQAMNTFLLDSFQRVLSQRGVRYFLLIMHMQTFLGPRAHPHPDEAELLTYLESTRCPFVDSRVEVQQALASGLRLKDLFVQGEASLGHPNQLGTEILFGALLRGLEGRFDGAGSARPHAGSANPVVPSR